MAFSIFMNVAPARFPLASHANYRVDMPTNPLRNKQKVAMTGAKIVQASRHSVKTVSLANARETGRGCAGRLTVGSPGQGVEQQTEGGIESEQ
ncbi:MULTISPECIES: hypothetical protein [unclassified Mesorhizobium]|uniref:hypothetical protein n=1 Tax=unclassified Mesorhizobium TaxID=325217 RepID=UPI003335CD36